MFQDYDTFLASDFDARNHVDAIVKKSEMEGDESEISAAFSKLTFSLDMLNKQIQEQVLKKKDKKKMCLKEIY